MLQRKSFGYPSRTWQPWTSPAPRMNSRPQTQILACSASLSITGNFWLLPCMCSLQGRKTAPRSSLMLRRWHKLCRQACFLEPLFCPCSKENLNRTSSNSNSSLMQHSRVPNSQVEIVCLHRESSAVNQKVSGCADLHIHGLVLLSCKYRDA